jgi:3-deoxy-D-manno-octulosonic-acid transferase
MNSFWIILYNILVVPFMLAGFYCGSLFNSKMKEGRRARQNQFSILQNAIAKAEADQKKILFHCTSAGEWLQALPIIERLKICDPRLYVMVSFFSPSGFNFAKNPSEVNLKFYLPLDSSGAAKRLFNLLKPECWIISKFDIWPNHVIEASKLHIPIVITAGTLSPDSGRDKGISRLFNKIIYSKISHFFPISEEDKKRFQLLVPDESKYTVAGDTRYDHVFNRGQKAINAADINIFSEKKRITIIAGSTWPADEKHILPALVRLLTEFPEIQTIIVPHELQENHLKDIENVFKRHYIECRRYSDFSAAGTTNARVVIFNTIGMLARLYKQTNIAFVGGSFGKGTHNVMEPAIFGQPVLFGPNHLNSYEAGELLKIGAAFKIRSEQEFYEKARLLINNDQLRISMGEKARNLIVENKGATEIIVNKLNEQYGIIS